MRKLTGVAGCFAGVLAIIEAVCKTIAGPRPSLDAGTELVRYMADQAPWTLAVVLTDTVLMAALIVFFAGLATLVRLNVKATFALTVGMSALVIFVILTLIGDSMDGGTALDATGAHASATVIRALIESHILLFGPIGNVFIALILVAFSYAVHRARLLPLSLVRFGYAIAALNVLAIPMVYGVVSVLIGGNTIALAALVGLIAWVTLSGGTLLLRNRA